MTEYSVGSSALDRVLYKYRLFNIYHFTFEFNITSKSSKAGGNKFTINVL